MDKNERVVIQVFIVRSYVLFMYLCFSIVYKSLDPLKWSHADAFLFWSLFFPITLIPLLVWQDKKFEVIINKIFDLDKYKNEKLKLLDCLLSHYSNIATIGLFIVVVIYIFRPYALSLPSQFISIILAFIITCIFFIYGLLIIRFAKYLQFKNTRKVLKCLSIYLIMVLDMHIIDLIIKNIPKV